MTRFTLATAALGCALVAVTGCQNSGHASADSDYYNRPQTASTYDRTVTTTTEDATPAGATIRADTTYTVPYTLQSDSAYRANMTATTDAGMLHKGDTVYLKSGSLTTYSDWVEARTADGRTVFVRAADLRPR